MRADPTISLTVAWKQGLPNYSSAEVRISLDGLPADATPEQIDELLDVGKVAFPRMTARLREKIAQAKKENGL